MNTNKIYYGMLRGVTEADRKLDSFCTPVWTVSSVPVKSVLVLVTQSCKGEIIIKDLNTKEIYMTEVPLEIGRLFINPVYLLPFNFSNDVPNKLSKKQILKTGNENLKEAEKTLIKKADYKIDKVFKPVTIKG